MTTKPTLPRDKLKGGKPVARNVAPPANLVGHPCHHCGLMFANRNHFESHMKSFHDPKVSTRYFVCDECGKSFTKKDDLKDHELDHDIATLIWALQTTKALSGGNEFYEPLKKSLDGTKDRSREQSAPRSRKPSPALVEKKDKLLVSLPVQAEKSKDRSRDATPAARASKRPMIGTPPSSSLPAKRARHMSPMSGTPELSATAAARQVFRPVSTGKRGRPRKIPLQAPPVIPKPPRPVARPQLAPAGAGAQPPRPEAKPRVLTSACPFCSSPHPRPWELVAHLAAKHDMQMAAINKREVSQFEEDVKVYNKEGCHVCQAVFPSAHLCLMHILEKHRHVVFSAAGRDCLECIVSLEMAKPNSGPEEENKFTVSVKVKKRAG